MKSKAVSGFADLAIGTNDCRPRSQKQTLATHPTTPKPSATSTPSSEKASESQWPTPHASHELYLRKASPSKLTTSAPISCRAGLKSASSKYYRTMQLTTDLLTMLNRPYTLHLNPTTFPDPFAFKPERWLEDPTPEMQRDWIPFGMGSRQCIARNLAMTELFLATRALARTNVLEGAEAVGEKIEMMEWFNSRIKGERIEVWWR